MAALEGCMGVTHNHATHTHSPSLNANQAHKKQECPCLRSLTLGEKHVSLPRPTVYSLPHRSNCIVSRLRLGQSDARQTHRERGGQMYPHPRTVYS